MYRNPRKSPPQRGNWGTLLHSFRLMEHPWPAPTVVRSLLIPSHESYTLVPPITFELKGADLQVLLVFNSGDSLILFHWMWLRTPLRPVPPTGRRKKCVRIRKRDRQLGIPTLFNKIWKWAQWSRLLHFILRPWVQIPSTTISLLFSIYRFSWNWYLICYLIVQIIKKDSGSGPY